MNRLRHDEDSRIEENIIKDVRNLFRQKKEVDDNIIKNIRNPFRLKKENEAIKDRITREISNLFELKWRRKLFQTNKDWK